MSRALPARAGVPDLESTLAAMFSAAQPDPLFVRRLRSAAVNRYVAVREGIDVPVDMPSERTAMGTLGRACLYASFVLGVSAASVLAASREALPGDALYALKTRVEQVRLEVLPEHLHDELYADALAQRIAEMSRLSELGRAREAMAMVPVIEDAYAQLIAALPAEEAGGRGRGHNLVVLEGLIERLPDGAQAAIEDVIDRAQGRGVLEASDDTDSGQGQPDHAGQPGVGADGHPHDAPPGQADATPRPDRTPSPDRIEAPEPSPTPRPTESPQGGSKVQTHEDDQGD